MTDTAAKRIDRMVALFPIRYPGPGGACAILQDGAVLVRHAWGWANAERRIPFTPGTLFRMCSITKQFTCGLVLDAFPDPVDLDSSVKACLPLLGQAAPSTLQLCHNQSGLRDYWAVAMLQGAPVEGAFGDADAERLVRATRTLQFAPGTRYSYCNQNFRILSDVLQERTGRSFAELLRTRIFDRVGMDGAMLAADTRAMPDGTKGYEGSSQAGFRVAENRVFWTGDAGLGASLNDMIAWERHIDATRDEAGSLYRRLSAPVTFADGNPAAYGFGLGRRMEFRRQLTSHGGALRGWRSHRMYVPEERVSVVVMFNHMADAHAAAVDLLSAVLGETRPPLAPCAAPAWLGDYFEQETGLAARIEAAGKGQIRLQYGHFPEILDLAQDGVFSNGVTRLLPDGDGLRMERVAENHCAVLRPIEGDPITDVAGKYRCAEIGAELDVVDAGGSLYGAFAGPLGQGRMELLAPVGGDIWRLPCPRGLDHTPPGDWTIRFERDNAGGITEATVGCWLARGLKYRLVH